MELRDIIHYLVDAEMDQTDENMSEPSQYDYIADIARQFNRLVSGHED